jgi:hypothetical protein
LVKNFSDFYGTWVVNVVFITPHYWIQYWTRQMQSITSLCRLISTLTSRLHLGIISDITFRFFSRIFASIHLPFCMPHAPLTSSSLLFIAMRWDYISEVRPVTGLLFIL